MSHSTSRRPALALSLCLLLVLAATSDADVPADKGGTMRFTFEDSPRGALPPSFEELLGTWRVESEASAPSPSHVLRQTARLRGPDFPRVAVAGRTFADLGLRVRCRPESGAVDQACGLMLRLASPDDYYLARANALEANVRLYRVVKGDRQQLASADAKVTSGEWHTLAVTARGRRLAVDWDGVRLIEAEDATFSAGRVGLWTKADSVTAFDDLEVTAE